MTKNEEYVITREFWINVDRERIKDIVKKYIEKGLNELNKKYILNILKKECNLEILNFDHIAWLRISGDIIEPCPFYAEQIEDMKLRSKCLLDPHIQKLYDCKKRIAGYGFLCSTFESHFPNPGERKKGEPAINIDKVAEKFADSYIAYKYGND